MSIAKFIDNVKESLGLDEFKKKGKKKSIKTLLKKLEDRREKIQKALDKKMDKKEKKELNEELDIIALHIKEGEKRLHRLNQR